MRLKITTHTFQNANGRTLTFDETIKSLIDSIEIYEERANDIEFRGARERMLSSRNAERLRDRLNKLFKYRHNRNSIPDKLFEPVIVGY